MKKPKYSMFTNCIYWWCDCDKDAAMMQFFRMLLTGYKKETPWLKRKQV